jgi:hypothetical protein
MQMLRIHLQERDTFRFQPDALTLTAACLWLVNSLDSRPADGPSSRGLMDAVLPLTDPNLVSKVVLAYPTSAAARTEQDEDDTRPDEQEEEDEQPNRVPHNPHGCIFLRHILSTQVPRFAAGGRALTPSAIKYWFGAYPDQLPATYRRTRRVEKHALVGQRVTTNKMLPPAYRAQGGEVDLFQLGDQGHVLPPLTLNPTPDDDRRSPTPQERNLDGFLSLLWRQFAIDIVAKSPNPHGAGNPSYLRLSETQRQTVTEDLYRNLSLSQIFRSVAYKTGSQNDWERAFKWLFPERGFVMTAKIQNYRQCRYFNMWIDFLQDDNNGDALVNDARQELRARLGTWQWLPDAQQDRMWTTKVHSGFTHWPPSNDPRNAPRILLQRRAKPDFTRLGGMGAVDEREV